MSNMHVRTFQAVDSGAALAQIKAELGAEAVILDTRSLVKDGRRICEITATAGSGPAGPAGTGRDRGVPTASASPMGGGDDMACGWAAGQPSWQPAWQKDWAEIKDCLATLMGRQLDKTQLPPRQRQALDHLERQEVDQAVRHRDHGVGGGVRQVLEEQEGRPLPGAPRRRAPRGGIVAVGGGIERHRDRPLCRTVQLSGAGRRASRPLQAVSGRGPGAR